MKLIEQLRNDPRVRDAWDEGEDGLWVTLKPGFQNAGFDLHCHTIHEWKAKDVRRRMRDVKPCDCAECLDGLKQPQL